MSALETLLRENPAGSAATAPVAIEAKRVSVSYGDCQCLVDISLAIPTNTVVALIGPSGCGKSTLLRSMNRTNELVAETRFAGEVIFRDRNIYDPGTNLRELRERVGMVFQRPNPFPKSVFDNVAWGPRSAGVRAKERIDEIVESSLRSAALWDAVKSDLHQPSLGLSGGQQQRLCIARALAVEPEVLLMDEPCSALDPIATQRIEDLIETLKERYTIVIVTHNMQQAARISDTTGFLLAEHPDQAAGLVEFGPSDQIFTRPQDPRTEAYITGRFG